MALPLQLTLWLMAACLFGQEQLDVVLNEPQGGLPAIRRTNPRDEPLLVKIVEERQPGTMAALFTLGYLRDPSPHTREVLRAAARSTEVLLSYPALCSLWRIDDTEWRTLAASALPRLTKTQQLHIASLLFRAGEFSRWPFVREQLLDLLAIPGSEQRLKLDVFAVVEAAWGMKDDAGEGASLRDLQRLLSKRPSSAERERSGKMLEEFNPKPDPRVQ